MNEQKINMDSLGNEKYKQPIYNEPMIAVLDAKESDGEEWAVYYGPESLGAEKIKREGFKAPESMARKLFPNISGSYRK